MSPSPVGMVARAPKRVCRTLELEPPGEFQPRFPDLPFLVARCEAEAKRRREATERKPLQLTDGDKPLDPARWANFRADLESLAKRKVMP